MLKTRKTLLFNIEYPKWILWLAIFWLTSSCTTLLSGAKIYDINRKFPVLLGAIEYASPGGVLRRGANNRSFFSRYHKPGSDGRIDATRLKKRGQSVIHVRNVRRPYTIVVQYRVEERFGDSYEVTEQDYEQAEKIKKRLEDYLASRPDEPDLIDDFRAF